MFMHGQTGPDHPLTGARLDITVWACELNQRIAYRVSIFACLPASCLLALQPLLKHYADAGALIIPVEVGVDTQPADIRAAVDSALPVAY